MNAADSATLEPEKNFRRILDIEVKVTQFTNLCADRINFTQKPADIVQFMAKL